MDLTCYLHPGWEPRIRPASPKREWMENAPERFAKATADSLPFAQPLPAVPQTADFVSTVWPTNMQRAMNGEVTPAQMMDNIAKHFSTK